MLASAGPRCNQNVSESGPQQQLLLFQMAQQQQVHGDLVQQPPSDGITRVRFSTPGDLLLASSWDGVGAQQLLAQPPSHQQAPTIASRSLQALHLYGADGSKRARYQQSAPALDCCFQQDNACYSGCVDGSISRYACSPSTACVAAMALHCRCFDVALAPHSMHASAHCALAVCTPLKGTLTSGCCQQTCMACHGDILSNKE